MKNVLDFLKQFNWIDIFVFCLSLRIAFIALKNGLAAEVFKILGTFTGL
jgi:uncharacterized membrane protein required for colicin V production